MKRKLLSVLLCVGMIAAMVSGCGQKSEEAAAPAADDAAAKETAAPAADDAEKTADSGEKVKVILITMDSSDQHWVSVDKGAKEEAEKLGNVDYKWMAPDKKDDAQQIERVNNAVADGADAIMIAANGPDAITAVLEDAKSQGVKIIYVDSPANTEAMATFSTDNKAAGKTAGEEMLKALKAAGKEEGKIGIVNISASTDSTANREAGFREAFEGTPYEILETQYGEGDAAKSQDIADNYITDGCVGIFGCNEGATVGTGNAIKGAGGGVIGVGFDKSDAILGLIKDGSLVACMGQNPDVMGKMGMDAAVAAVKGEPIPETNVDTGVSVLTKDSIQ